MSILTFIFYIDGELKPDDVIKNLSSSCYILKMKEPVKGNHYIVVKINIL